MSRYSPDGLQHAPLPPDTKPSQGIGGAAVCYGAEHREIADSLLGGCLVQ